MAELTGPETATQRRRAGNVWHSAMARSVLQTIVPPRREPGERQGPGQPAAR